MSAEQSKASGNGCYVNDGFQIEGAREDGIPTRCQQPREHRMSVVLSRGEKWRILKNVALISFAFMVQFTAFQGIANLQSSINASEGLGTASLCAIYAALVVSCVFVPTLVIKRLTAKWTLCASMLCYAPYIAAQFFPKFYTLIPTGIVVGLGAAPMWAAKGSYLTQIASIYARLTDQPVDGIIVRFFGFFFFFWQTSELWGNLVSSLVFSSGEHSPKSLPDNEQGRNGSDPFQVVKQFQFCGAEFHASKHQGNDNLERPPDYEIYEIAGIYMACVLIAVAIIVFFLDPLSRYGERTNTNEDMSTQSLRKLLSATYYQLKKPYQELLIPISVWVGMEQAFIGADFTQAFVSCSVGIHSIGYVMICYGVINAICSVIFGTAMKFSGRIPIIVFGFVIHVFLLSTLLFWKPNPNNSGYLYGIGALWGAGDAVWQTQIHGLYGTLFRRNKEAAFSNYRLWESVGFVIAYAYSNHLYVSMKLYIMLAVLIVGFIGYVIVEIAHKQKVRRLKAAAANKQLNIPTPQEEEQDDEKDDIDDNIIITHL